MTAVLACLVVLAFGPLALCGADRAVLATPSSSRPFPAVLYRKSFGPQDTGLTVSAAPLTVLHGTAPRTSADLQCDGFQDSVVFVENDRALWSMREDLRTFLALQGCGARAILRRMVATAEVRDALGFGYYRRDYDCCTSQGHQLHIPVLHVLSQDFADVVPASGVLTAANVTVDGLDTNRWLEVYRTAAFVVFAQVLLPITNAVALLVSLRGVVLHAQRIWKPQARQRPTVFDSVRPHIVVALLLQSVGSAMRMVYCAVTPFFSNSTLTYQAAQVLINLPMALQLPCVFVVSALCRRIMSMRRYTGPPKGWKAVVSVLYCVVAVSLELAESVRRAYDHGFFFNLRLGIVLVVMMLVFAVVGTAVPFLKRARESERARSRDNRSSTSQQIRRRFVKSMERGTVGLVCQVVLALVYAVFPTVVSTPIGFTSAFICYYASMTVSALYYSLALAPLSRTRVKRKVSERSYSGAVAYLVDAPPNQDQPPGASAAAPGEDVLPLQSDPEPGVGPKHQDADETPKEGPGRAAQAAQAAPATRGSQEWDEDDGDGLMDASMVQAGDPFVLSPKLAGLVPAWASARLPRLQSTKGQGTNPQETPSLEVCAQGRDHTTSGASLRRTHTN